MPSRRSPCELTEPTRQCPVSVSSLDAEQSSYRMMRETEMESLENARCESTSANTADRAAIDINNRVSTSMLASG